MKTIDIKFFINFTFKIHEKRNYNLVNQRILPYINIKYNL